MDAFIQQQGLERYRGMIVPRNSHSSPWVSIFDLRFAQEIPGFRDMRGTLTVDVENVANLINSDWGQYRAVSFPYVSPTVNARIHTASVALPCGGGRTTGTCYAYRPISGTTPTAPNFSLGNAQTSVWRVQLGFRIEF